MKDLGAARVLACMVLALGIFPAQSHAQEGQQLLGSSRDASVYVYPNSKRQTSPGIIEIWSIYDFHEKQAMDNVVFWSVKSLNYLDCRNRRIGIANDIYFDGRRDQGRIVKNVAVTNISEIRWQYVPPNSMSEAKFDFGCLH